MRILVIQASGQVFKLNPEQQSHIKRTMQLVSVPERKKEDIKIGGPYPSCPTYVEELPRLCAVGLALFESGEWYRKEKHDKNKWAIGPFCYNIKDAVKFPEPIPCLGKLGFFRITSSVLKKCLRFPKVLKKVEMWKRKYKDEMWKEDKPSAFRGLSVKQPFAEAIVRGVKKVENRSRSIGQVDPNSKSPSKPKVLQSRRYKSKRYEITAVDPGYSVHLRRLHKSCQEVASQETASPNKSAKIKLQFESPAVSPAPTPKSSPEYFPPKTAKSKGPTKKRILRPPEAMRPPSSPTPGKPPYSEPFLPPSPSSDSSLSSSPSKPLSPSPTKPQDGPKDSSPTKPKEDPKDYSPTKPKDVPRDSSPQPTEPKPPDGSKKPSRRPLKPPSAALSIIPRRSLRKRAIPPEFICLPSLPRRKPRPKSAENPSPPAPTPSAAPEPPSSSPVTDNPAPQDMAPTPAPVDPASPSKQPVVSASPPKPEPPKAERRSNRIPKKKFVQPKEEKRPVQQKDAKKRFLQLREGNPRSRSRQDSCRRRRRRSWDRERDRGYRRSRSRRDSCRRRRRSLDRERRPSRDRSSRDHRRRKRRRGYNQAEKPAKPGKGWQLI